MNQTLCNGVRVAKSRILAKNREDSWVAMCYEIHFCTANLFLNRARVRIGLSARLIGHHQNFYGPISCMVWLPDTVNIWVVSHMFNFKESFNMYYHLTFTKTIKLPKIIALIAATLCALFIPPLVRSSRSIPVYRESRNIMKTFNRSMELLNKGEQILIFPDIKYNDNSHIMGEIHTGFTHLEKLYHKSNNSHIGFVPINIDKATGIITNTSSIYFSDDKSYKVGKNIS